MKIIDRINRLITNKDLLEDIKNSFKIKNITNEFLATKYNVEIRYIKLLKLWHRGNNNMSISIKNLLLSPYEKFEEIANNVFEKKEPIYAKKLAIELEKDHSTIISFLVYYYGKTGRIFDVKNGRPFKVKKNKSYNAKIIIPVFKPKKIKLNKNSNKKNPFLLELK